MIQNESRGTQAQPPVIFEDHLGARFEAVSPDGEPVEVFELKEQFAGIPAFEFALRKRVNTLTAFKDPSFATARGVRLGGGLAIVSDRVRGARLSTILAAFENDLIPVEFNAAVCVLRQLVSAVAVLHETMPEICHGAISPERIVITPEGRVVIVEHMLGLGARGAALLGSTGTWTSSASPCRRRPVRRASTSGLTCCRSGSWRSPSSTDVR